MTPTTLYKNESYLGITTAVSVGVLSGYEYTSIVLAVLLIAPFVIVFINNIICKQQLHISSPTLKQYVSCKECKK
jgi:hypothetical protein